eukprot:GHVS01024660.1.p1 GENE.GHVS01024660.1~~GHVS01024660.1.p1  ORF type:complete len:801 (+),score=126.44 GHVS01024660.1:195-2597(+)
MKPFHEPTEVMERELAVSPSEPVVWNSALGMAPPWCLCLPQVDRAEEVFGTEDSSWLGRSSVHRDSLDACGRIDELVQTKSWNRVAFYADGSLKHDVPENDATSSKREGERKDSDGMVLLTEDDVRCSLLLSAAMLRKSLTTTLWGEEEPREVAILEQRVTEEVLPDVGPALSDATSQSTIVEAITVVTSTSLITRSVDWEPVPISKVRIADVEKVIRLHIKRLDDYCDCEKLFVANKYLEHLRSILRYNTDYWQEFLEHLQFLNPQGVTSYHGAVGEDECRGILRVLNECSELITIRPEALAEGGANNEHLTKYETLTIKVKLALKILSSFRLDYLKVNCVPPPIQQPSVKLSERLPSRMMSGSPAPSWLNQSDPATSSVPVDSTSSPGAWSFHPPHLPIDGAEAALRVSGMQQALTSNIVLLMLLKGTHGGCFMPASIESPRTEVEPPGTPLAAVEENRINAGDELPQRPPKSRGSWTGGAPLKTLSKRVSSGISRKPRRSADKQTAAHTCAQKSSGSSIGKMGSKMLYSLTHHHALLPPQGNPHKRMAMEDADSWNREKTKFLDLWYRTEKDTSISIKVRGKLSCALFEVLAILNETDLAGNWAPMFKSATKEEQMSRASQMVRQVFDYPLLGQKESIMYCFGVDALSECGCVMIFCLPPPELSPFYLGAKLPVKGKMPRVQAATMCFLLFPISQGRQTTLELYANFVHGVRFVPSKLIAYVVKKVVKGMFVSICRQCQNFADSEYAERVKADPYFYDWMRDTITDFCGGGEGGDLSGCRLFGDTISLASFDINEFD